MPEDRVDALIRRAIGGDEDAIGDVLAGAALCHDARIVALAAVLGSRADWIARAQRLAVTSRDRQTVAIIASHVSGDRSLVHVLARDHLADNPDNLIVAWIASLDPP